MKKSKTNVLQTTSVTTTGTGGEEVSTNFLVSPQIGNVGGFRSLNTNSLTDSDGVYTLPIRMQKELEAETNLKLKTFHEAVETRFLKESDKRKKRILKYLTLLIVAVLIFSVFVGVLSNKLNNKDEESEDQDSMNNEQPTITNTPTTSQPTGSPKTSTNQPTGSSNTGETLSIDADELVAICRGIGEDNDLSSSDGELVFGVCLSNTRAFLCGIEDDGDFNIERNFDCADEDGTCDCTFGQIVDLRAVEEDGGGDADGKEFCSNEKVDFECTSFETNEPNLDLSVFI